ncbi:MAG: hypothetical protein Q4G08_08695 [Capnocytophaga sp.]|nr:hypothetical protein [Capnocytophaga sp.]
MKKEYRYYETLDGSIYTRKKERFAIGLLIASGLGLLFLAFKWFYGKEDIPFYTSLIISLVLFILAYTSAKGSLEIDTRKRTLTAVRSILLIKREYSFDKFVNFEAHRVLHYGFIPSNFTAHAYFLDEKNKEYAVVLMSRVFFGNLRMIQRVIDETAEIMGVSETEFEN